MAKPIQVLPTWSTLQVQEDPSKFWKPQGSWYLLKQEHSPTRGARQWAFSFLTHLQTDLQPPQPGWGTLLCSLKKEVFSIQIKRHQGHGHLSFC